MVIIVLACSLAVLFAYVVFLHAQRRRAPSEPLMETAEGDVELHETLLGNPGEQHPELPPEPPTLVNMQGNDDSLLEVPAIAPEGPRGQDPELTLVEPGVDNRPDPPEEFQDENSVVNSDLDDSLQENHSENELFHDVASVENASAVVEPDTAEDPYALVRPPVNEVVFDDDSGVAPMADAFVLGGTQNSTSQLGSTPQ